MKQYRKWFYTGLIIVVIELGSVALLNYIVDPFGLFRYGTWRHDVLHQYTESNKNFVKTRYLGLNPNKFDCLVVGSSRVNAIDVREIKEANCYNMTIGQGLPRDYLENLRYILGKGARPKLVLMAVDEFSYKIDPAEHFTDYLRYPYPPAVHQNTFLFYLGYLVRYSSRSMKEPLEGFFGKIPPTPYDHYVTGLTLPDPAGEAKIDEDPVTYGKQPKFNMPLVTDDGYSMKKALEEIKETLDLLKSHGIRVIVFMNPIHRTTYLAMGLNNFFLFEKELSKITSFWDFNGLSSITTNNANYYETSHYRFKIGTLILARMLNNPNVKVPDDFGVLVTSENIDEHLAYLRSQVEGMGAAVKW